MPVEMLEKILLYAAVSKSSPMENNSLDVYRGLASVCRLWRDVMESDHFRYMYLEQIANREYRLKEN